MADEREVRMFVTQYTIPPPGMGLSDPNGFHREIKVEHRDLDRWAVIRLSQCLNENDEWEYEPQPSSRDDDFKRRCRFPREEALKRAQRAAREGTP